MAASSLRGARILGAASRVTLTGPRVVARRCLGDTTKGPKITDFQGNLKHAREFFKNDAVSYYQFKQQCQSLRLFVFGGVTAGCCVALFWDPPKSSYWTTWGPMHWFSTAWGVFSKSGMEPLFLTHPLKHETDVGELARGVINPALGRQDAASESAPAKSSKKMFKVCVFGGAGGIGQPLSMLMAMDDRVRELSLVDLSVAMVPAEGVAQDLSHMEFPSKVKAYSLDLADKPADKLEECLAGCDLVLVPAGLPRRPGMTRADLLGVNCGIAKNTVEAIARHCPDAVVALIVNPVNSVVPAMAELYKKKGLDASKIVGVTTLDIVRANKFVSEATGKALEDIKVPVIGGHAGETILPLFSQVKAMQGMSEDTLKALDKRVQDAGTEVVEAKRGKGSATLSMAYAGARLGKAILSGLSGERTEEYAYVASSISDLPYFASKVTFGPKGVEQVHPLPTLSPYEQERLKAVKKQLKSEIDAGIEYAKDNSLE